VFGLFNKSRDAHSSQPGTFGRFQLQELVNSGGMAEIWLATDSKHRSVAVRRLHPHLGSDSLAKKRFLHGCEVMQKIPDHDCIIGYVEHGKIGGRLYCVMDYVEGANLKELLARHDPVLLDNVAQIILDMASGLEHMHENGFMHLDFKPENIIVTRNGSVRLVDFDLAQEIPEKPFKLKKNPGTPNYMSPEQLSGQPIDQRVDVFAFGVAAYELLTSTQPFPGQASAEILNCQLNRVKFKTPRQLNPDLPQALERIVLKCIEANPDKRYPFFSMLMHDLKGVLYV